ncbi:hypothetical protein KBB05_05480 [Patescibacteria group bacterium]|nr:hypothetical protein [Patescibacteria group bacterium]
MGDIKRLIDLFDAEKQEYIGENQKIKEIYKQINEIKGNESRINKILSHPQA